jgi:hypothetical protein
VYVSLTRQQPDIQENHMNRTMRASLGITLAAAATLGLGACSAGHEDAAIEPGGIDNSPAQVVQFPSGFRNVAHKCDGPNMVYSASRGQSTDAVAGSVFVVPNDPRCPGAKPTTP